MRAHNAEAGFNLAELLIAMAVMLLISGAATTALLKMGSTQATIWNRTQMHSGIRGATEVLQQEVGQAGRIALPASVTLTAPVTAAASVSSPTVSSASGIFVGEKLTIDAGCYDTSVTPCISRQEVVTVMACTSSTNSACTNSGTESITATFANLHASGVNVHALGGFHAGIVPESTPNGSTESVLKLFGDINGDGTMMYVEYSITPACLCSTTPCSGTGNLYRNSMAWNTGTKLAASASQILLSNITANPNSTKCFTYQPTTAVNTRIYVTDVAITLTVQTQVIDPITKAYQKETKALLNVTPRNVYNTWQLASLGYIDRVQETPPTIANLLAGSGS
jgi:prepilin-type N-terminal cleavage/methylation domain-containing protein